jgi:uncharacterized protein (TIRG00374 family)
LSTPPRRRRFLDWKAVVGILISAIALYFAFRGRDWAEVAAHMRRANILLILLATALSTFVFWIRAWRWRYILAPIAVLPFRSRFAAVNIGFAANNLLPARVGEFLRAYSLSRLEPRVPIVSSFASLIMERLFDGVLVISLLFISMALPGFPAFSATQTVSLPGIGDYTIAGLARGVAVFIGLGMVFVIILVSFPRQAVRTIERMVTVLPKPVRRLIVDALEAFLRGVAVLRNVRLVLWTALWSVVLWLTNALSFWVAFYAFGFHLPFSAALFFQSFVAIAVSIPSAPGYVGVYHAAAIFVIATLFEGNKDQAAAFAVGFHIAAFIPVTVMGLVYAWKMGISMREATQSEEIVEEAVEEDIEKNPDAG